MTPEAKEREIVSQMQTVQHQTVILMKIRICDPQPTFQTTLAK
jgi:hypothetical protein